MFFSCSLGDSQINLFLALQRNGMPANPKKGKNERENTLIYSIVQKQLFEGRNKSMETTTGSNKGHLKPPYIKSGGPKSFLMAEASCYEVRIELIP